MQAQEVEQRVDAAELNGGKSPGPAREARLAMVVVVTARISAAVISMPVRSTAPVAEARMPWAVQAERSARSPYAISGKTMSCAPSGVRTVTNGRLIRPAPDPRSCALQAATSRDPRRHPQPGTVVRVPDPEQAAGVHLAGKARDLLGATVPGEQAQRVDMTLIESAERQAAMADSPQEAHRRADLARGRAQPEPA